MATKMDLNISQNQKKTKLINNLLRSLTSSCYQQTIMKIIHLGRVIYMTVVTTLFFSISLSVDTIFPEFSQQIGYTYVGQISLILIFLSEMFANSFGQYFLNTTHYNRQFFVCSIFPPIGILPVILMKYCHDSESPQYYCQGVYMYPITLLGFIFQGIGLGFIFMLQNTYISAASTDENRDQIFGICYSIFGSSYLISSLLSNQTIEVIGQFYFFCMLTGLQLVFSFLFLFVKNEDKNLVKIKDSHWEGQKVQNVSVLEATSFRQSLNQWKQSINESQKKLKQKSVKLLLPHFTLTGVVIGLQLGQFYQLIIETLDQNENELVINKKTYAVFIAVGIGEVMSGPFVSIVKGKISLRTYMIVYTVYTSLSIILAIVNFYLKSYLVCFIIGFSWGVVDNFGLNTAVMSVSQYWGESLAMFGIYLFTQNMAVVTCTLIALLSLVYQSEMMVIGFSVALTVSITALICNIRFFQYVTNDQSVLLEKDEIQIK